MEKADDGTTSQIWQTIREALHIIYLSHKIEKVRECMAAIGELENGELAVIVQIIGKISTDGKRLRPKNQKKRGLGTTIFCRKLCEFAPSRNNT
jgi:hypothetical protein